MGKPPLSVIAVISFIAVSLAGCVGGSGGAKNAQAAPPSAPDAGFDADTGGIQGRVVSDESLPVQGAEVGLMQGGKVTGPTATTALDGGFSFSNLAPGSYQILAQRIGFESAARAVEVAAGAATPVTVILASSVVKTEFHDVWTKQGYFDCNWQMYPPALIGGTNGPCGNFPVAGNVSQVSDQFDYNRRAYVYPAKPGLMSVVHELTWKQGSYATGDKLAATFSYANRTGYHWFCRTDAGNPLRLEWQRAEELGKKEKGDCATGSSQYGDGGSEMPTVDYEKGLMVRTFISTGPAKNPATGANFDTFALAYQQDFEITFSLFYYGRAPEGYSSLKDT